MANERRPMETVFTRPSGSSSSARALCHTYPSAGNEGVSSDGSGRARIGVSTMG